MLMKEWERELAAKIAVVESMAVERARMEESVKQADQALANARIALAEFARQRRSLFGD